MKTQRKITCLGIEVMGIEHFGGLRSKGSGISKERLNTVASASREQQKAEADFNSVLQIQGEEVQGVTREAISSSKVQGKVSVIAITMINSFPVVRTFVARYRRITNFVLHHGPVF